MKALSIMQPWITDILIGEKTIEVRTRNTSHRGDVLLCSSKAPDWPKEEMKRLEEDLGFPCPCGVALCVADLVDSRPLRKGDEDATGIDAIVPGKLFGWVLESIRPVVPFPVTGKLGFYEVDDNLIQVSPFALWSSVRIRDGVDSSDLSFPVAGLHGWVAGFELPKEGRWTYGVMLDSLSLQNVPLSHLEACAAEGTEMWHTLMFDMEEIEPAEPRDTVEETWSAAGEIEARRPTLFPKEQGE